MAGDKFAKLVAAGKISAAEATKRRAQSRLDKAGVAVVPPVAARKAVPKGKKKNGNGTGTNLSHVVWNGAGFLPAPANTEGISLGDVFGMVSPNMDLFQNVQLLRVNVELTSSLWVGNTTGARVVCGLSEALVPAANRTVSKLAHLKGHVVHRGEALDKRYSLAPRAGDRRWWRKDGKKTGGDLLSGTLYVVLAGDGAGLTTGHYYTVTVTSVWKCWGIVDAVSVLSV